MCYCLAMAAVQHIWLERPRRLRLHSTQLFNSTVVQNSDNDMTSDFTLQFQYTVYRRHYLAFTVHLENVRGRTAG